MKKNNLLTIIFSLLNFLAIAQENAVPITNLKFDNEYTNRTNPVINGKIINASEQELQMITLQFTLVRPNEPLQTQLTTQISRDGRFQFVAPSKLPYQQIWFSLDNLIYSCLYTNEELNLEIDFQKLKKESVFMIGEGLSFSGKDGETNKILNEYILFNKEHIPELSKEIWNLNPKDSDVLNKLDSLFDLQRMINYTFFKKNNGIAKNIIENETEAEYLSHKMGLLLHQDQLIVDIKDLLLPIYAISNASTNYLRSLHRYTVNKKLTSTNERMNKKIKFSKIDSIFPPPYADLIKLQISSKDLPEQLSINQEIISSSKTKWISQYLNQESFELTKKIHKMKELLSGKVDSVNNKNLGTFLKSTSFHGNLYLNESKTGEELLKTIRTAFPKKYIILDLWATWCGPCINNMPHSKQLFQQVEHEKLPVVFAYLCTDVHSSDILWQNKIAELEQPGEHIFVQNQQINELMELFNTSGFPTYAIVKPDGQIDVKTINLNRKMSIEELKKYISK